MSNEKETTQEQEKKNEQIIEMGEAILGEKRKDHVIYLLSIIGEIEGHDCLPSTSKTTKYEHVLPKLATIEDDNNIDGVLLLLNTMGGDVESGCFNEQTDGISCLRRKPFNRGAAGCMYRLFADCSKWHHGDSSGADEWDRHWGKTDI